MVKTVKTGKNGVIWSMQPKWVKTVKNGKNRKNAAETVKTRRKQQIWVKRGVNSEILQKK
jgi:hypothetical protein